MFSGFFANAFSVGTAGFASETFLDADINQNNTETVTFTNTLNIFGTTGSSLQVNTTL